MFSNETRAREQPTQGLLCREVALEGGRARTGYDFLGEYEVPTADLSVVPPHLRERLLCDLEMESALMSRRGHRGCREQDGETQKPNAMQHAHSPFVMRVSARPVSGGGGFDKHRH